MLTVAQRVELRKFSQELLAEVLYDNFENLVRNAELCELGVAKYIYCKQYIQSLTMALEDGRATFTPDPNDSDE